jgi:hypothetical protein|tara:strand:+ start:5137 stop:5712 length:576 start_codon:yes stop_codon:yes gene_type:complete
MPFWTSALSEPRRAHRFLLTLPNLTSAADGYQYEQYLAKLTGKPSYQITDTKHQFLGNTYYYPGTVEWQPIDITIVNAVNPDGNKLLMDALVNSGYLMPPDQLDAFENPAQAPGTVNKASSVDALGNVVIQELNGGGGLVGTWKLWNSFLTKATFGNLDYSSDEILNIEVSVRYDWAEYKSGPAVAAAAGS